MTDIIQSIGRLCHEVNFFSNYNAWHWKGTPVIEWEFADIHDFMFAKCALLQNNDLLFRVISAVRSPAPHIWEIDCCNVTFRLICRAVLMTERGPYGAAEIKFDASSDQVD
jgi:hypothetical protein